MTQFQMFAPSGQHLTQCLIETRIAMAIAFATIGANLFRRACDGPFS